MSDDDVLDAAAAAGLLALMPLLAAGLFALTPLPGAPGATFSPGTVGEVAAGAIAVESLSTFGSVACPHATGVAAPIINATPALAKTLDSLIDLTSKNLVILDSIYDQQSLCPEITLSS
jgi:hypothetical protein